MPKKNTNVVKLDIVCGEGQHRMWTASLAELIMLNKYGNQPDFFWRLPKYKDEYLRLIKLCGKIGKQFGRDKLAWYIYKEKASLFDNDVGLIIWKLKGYKFNNPEFTLTELVSVYKNLYRPKTSTTEISNPEIKVFEDKSVNLNDFLGDI